MYFEQDSPKTKSVSVQKLSQNYRNGDSQRREEGSFGSFGKFREVSVFTVEKVRS